MTIPTTLSNCKSRKLFWLVASVWVLVGLGACHGGFFGARGVHGNNLSSYSQAASSAQRGSESVSRRECSPQVTVQIDCEHQESAEDAWNLDELARLTRDLVSDKVIRVRIVGYLIEGGHQVWHLAPFADKSPCFDQSISCGYVSIEKFFRFPPRNPYNFEELLEKCMGKKTVVDADVYLRTTIGPPFRGPEAIVERLYSVKAVAQ